MSESVRDLERRDPSELDDLDRVRLVRGKALSGEWVVVASVSGGKDSAAMSLYLTELGIPHRRVFADTGWEHETTYRYLDVLREKLGPIDVARGPRDMVELIRHKGMFPSRQKRFCTQELKVFPLARYMKGLAEREGVEVVNAVGIRAEESEARSKFAPWEHQETFDCDVWRPLLKWSLDDVVAIHRRHNLLPNPIYLQGASRVGCWPCIYARKDEVRFISEVDPGRIDQIRALEEEVTAAAVARGDDRYRSFFALWQLGEGTRACAPIDEVVAWSKTASGGRNLALFQPGPPDEGCMRWGACSTSEDGWPAEVVQAAKEESRGGEDCAAAPEGEAAVESGQRPVDPVRARAGDPVHGDEVQDEVPGQGRLFLELEAGRGAGREIHALHGADEACSSDRGGQVVATEESAMEVSEEKVIEVRAVVEKALVPLSNEQKARVLNAAIAYYGIELKPKAARERKPKATV